MDDVEHLLRDARVGLPSPGPEATANARRAVLVEVAGRRGVRSSSVATRLRLLSRPLAAAAPAVALLVLLVGALAAIIVRGDAETGSTPTGPTAAARGDRPVADRPPTGPAIDRMRVFRRARTARDRIPPRQAVFAITMDPATGTIAPLNPSRNPRPPAVRLGALLLEESRLALVVRPRDRPRSRGWVVPTRTGYVCARLGNFSGGTCVRRFSPRLGGITAEPDFGAGRAPREPGTRAYWGLFADQVAAIAGVLDDGRRVTATLGENLYLLEAPRGRTFRWLLVRHRDGSVTRLKA